MPAQTTFKLRRGASTLWTSTNPVLNPGEPGLETDTNKVKYGDGVTAWNALDYASGGASVEVGVTAPVDPQPNTLWFNSETATMYIRLGSIWVETSPALIGPQGPAGEAGPQGLQGPSGVISVSSPITNSGTTTEAVLGLNQSALSITKSQVSDFAHTHPTSEVTGLDTALAGKAATVHTHAIADVTNLQTSLDAKAPLTQQVVINGTDSSRTILASDNGKLIMMYPAEGNVTVTVANVLPAGGRIDFINQGSSNVTFVAGAGVTIYSKDSKTVINGTYAAASLLNPFGNGTYYLIGDLKA